MNKFVEAIVMILALLGSLVVIGTILNVTQIIFHALQPILIIVGIGFIAIVILSILYPYIVMTIRIVGIIGILLYILGAVGGSFYLVWKLLIYIIEQMAPIIDKSWFNHNGIDNLIDIAIIFFPLTALLVDYVMNPMINFLLSPVFNQDVNNLQGEK